MSDRVETLAQDAAVAWRIAPADTLFLRGSCVTDDAGVAEIWRKAGNTIEPLYTASQPPAAAPTQGAAREQSIEAIVGVLKPGILGEHPEALRIIAAEIMDAIGAAILAAAPIRCLECNRPTICPDCDPSARSSPAECVPVIDLIDWLETETSVLNCSFIAEKLLQKFDVRPK